MSIIQSNKRQNQISAIMCAMVMLTRALASGEVTVADNHITLFGKKFFRCNSPGVVLGSYGEKKTPLFGQNHLEVQDNIPAPKIDAAPVDKATTVSIDFTKSSQSDIEAFVSGIIPVGGSGKVTYSRLKSSELKLVYLVIQAGPLKDQVNSAKKVLDNLRSYGSDARVCHEILVAMEATTADAFSNSGSLKVSKSGNGLQISTTGSKSSTVTLSPGTTFAYLLAKADWDDGKNQVKIFTSDQWSLE